METELLKANKDWLIWARESLFYDIESVAKKIKVKKEDIVRWERTGEVTNEELDLLSELYKQNSAIFFNVNKPRNEEFPVDFRTINNKKINISPKIAFEIRNAKLRR